jgi:hypothetical protein
MFVTSSNRKNATNASTIKVVFLTSCRDASYITENKLLMLSLEKGSFLRVGPANFRFMPLTTSVTTGSLTGEASPCKLCAHDKALKN